MTEHQKLIFIGETLQDVINCIEWGKLKSKPTLGLDEGMINESLTMVEDLRGKHFDKADHFAARLNRLENLLKPLMDEQQPGDHWNPLEDMMEKLEKKQDIPSAWDD